MSKTDKKNLEDQHINLKSCHVQHKLHSWRCWSHSWGCLVLQLPFQEQFGSAYGSMRRYRWQVWSCQAEYSVPSCGCAHCLPGDSHVDLILLCAFKVWSRKNSVPRRPDATSVPQCLTSATVYYPPENLGAWSLTAVCPESSYLFAMLLTGPHSFCNF